MPAEDGIRLHRQRMMMLWEKGIAPPGLTGDSERLRQFRARPSDVLVATPMKSGTTVLMQMCHQLRTHGAPFTAVDQYAVMPWVDSPPDVLKLISFGIDEDHVANPRVFKTHAAWRQIQVCGRCRAITCWRDPADVLLSAFYFTPPFVGLRPGTDIPLDDYCKDFLAGSMPILLKSLVEWWQHRNDASVLFLLFDEILKEPSGVVRRVANFIGVDADESLVKTVVQQTSHAAMSKDATKYDEHRWVALMADVGGFPRVPLAGKVRTGGGRSGQGAEELPAWAQQQLAEMWESHVRPATGFADFAAMSRARQAEIRGAAGSRL
eukprot:gnl/TRDRNA2_/TRDRNA2_163068_c0_seq1.p1 gnl/TRDRNA2_/TRDRNA2_163068_c0~~gnl/TRDRNA2_/TRDRNA2_163068_c0_seq1.p1  ORF type:complete len:322 (+),score=58.86 gnl/TRDRNA2_/TRDRNA2_163068_c0_seq1:148-1113(+)